MSIKSLTDPTGDLTIYCKEASFKTLDLDNTIGDTLQVNEDINCLGTTKCGNFYNTSDRLSEDLIPGVDINNISQKSLLITRKKITDKTDGDTEKILVNFKGTCVAEATGLSCSIRINLGSSGAYAPKYLSGMCVAATGFGISGHLSDIRLIEETPTNYTAIDVNYQLSPTTPLPITNRSFWFDITLVEK
jgi:hypothetical protein